MISKRKRIILFTSLILVVLVLSGCTRSLSAGDLRRQYEQERLEENAREESRRAEEAEKVPHSNSVAGANNSPRRIEIPENPVSNTQRDVLQVSFIDVGQGDCIFLKTGGHDMLIDSGSYEHSGAVIQFLKKQGAGDSLDIIVATHPDADHIGGIPDVIDHFKTGFLLSSGVEEDTPSFNYLRESIIKNRVMEVQASAGQSYALGNAMVNIEGPVSGSYDEENNASVVCRVNFGSTSFLFMGDAETEEENSILARGEDITCNVLKLGHHGSSSSSGVSFLKAASPEYAVISCGRGNDYGHPHEEVMHTLEVMGIKTYRTDEQGTVTAISDGKGIRWDKDPSETYESGSNHGEG